MSRPQKHSLTLRGHRTSVSLEAEFWAAFRALAARRGQAINEAAASIDAARGATGLATAIRLEVLRDLQARARARIATEMPTGAGQHDPGTAAPIDGKS